MPKITSWVNRNGTLGEGDTKLYPCDDGTYDIETKNESIGFALGRDKATKKYTVIVRVDYSPKIEKIKSLISVGDILVSINDRLVLEEDFGDIAMFLNGLIQGEVSRRLKFLSVKNCPVNLYERRLALNGQLQTDLLGFNCSFEYDLGERAFHAMQSTTTHQRDLEWVEYLKSIGGPDNLKPGGLFKPTGDLKQLVRRGIPVAYRALVWQRISLSYLHKLEYPANYYTILLDRITAGELDGRVRDDIEKDIDRTFPEHGYFQASSGGESSLRRVLQAFALHIPDVGYCQSLNFLAGMMLILMQEEDAFWLLVTVVERLLPADYYTKSMVGTYADQFVLAHLIKRSLPKIHSAFEKHQIQLPLITVQWFMCLFINTLRPEVALRVWDVFLNEGSKVLFRVAAALFRVNESKLLAAKDAADLFHTLRSIGKDVMDADLLMASSFKNYSSKPVMAKKSLNSNQSTPRSRSDTPTSSAKSTKSSLSLRACYAEAESILSTACLTGGPTVVANAVAKDTLSGAGNYLAGTNIAAAGIDAHRLGRGSSSSSTIDSTVATSRSANNLAGYSSSSNRNSNSGGNSTRDMGSGSYQLSSNGNSSSKSDGPVVQQSQRRRSSSVNPRLSLRYSAHQGSVPDDLTGLGVAHLGPLCLETPSPNASFKKTISSAAPPSAVAGGGAAAGVEKPPLGKSSSGDRDSSASGENSPHKHSVKVKSEQLPSPLASSAQPLSRLAASSDGVPQLQLPATNNTSLYEKYLMMASDRLPFEVFIAKYPHKSPSQQKSEHQQHSSSNNSNSSSNSSISGGSSSSIIMSGNSRFGEVSFSRGEIALWRSSFRPPLEDQHRNMEEMRRKFRQPAPAAAVVDFKDEPSVAATNTTVTAAAAAQEADDSVSKTHCQLPEQTVLRIDSKEAVLQPVVMLSSENSDLEGCDTVTCHTDESNEVNDSG